MYTPKLMLLFFNFILVILSINAVLRGMTDHQPDKLKPLENVTGMTYFNNICTYGGAMMFVVALFGFWSIDIENRMGLVTYKILLCLMIGLQVGLVCYYGFDDVKLAARVDSKLKEWTSDFLKNNKFDGLDSVQSFLMCCEVSRNSTKFPDSCCPADLKYRKVRCDVNSTYKNACNKTAIEYIQKREARFTWYIFQHTYPEFAAAIFADMLARKIWILQNLLLGKLP